MRREITLVIKQVSTGFKRRKQVRYTPEQIEIAIRRLNQPQGDYVIIEVIDDET